MTGKMERDAAETIEAMMIRRRLADALKDGVISGRESIREQLNKAGLLNRNRGRDPSRWAAIDIDLTSLFAHICG